MDKAASDLREAMDRYFRVQAVAFVRRKVKGPADPGFEPLSDDELAALEEAGVRDRGRSRGADRLGCGWAAVAWVSV